MAGVCGMIVKELRFRPLSAALVFVTVASACALVVFYQTGSAALEQKAAEAEDATRRIQKAMGTNLTLIPAATDLSAYYDAGGVAPDTVAESVIDRLVAQDAVSMNHLILMLEARIELGGERVLFTGIAASEHTPGRPKKKMNDGVEPGSLELGSAVAEALGVDFLDSIDLDDLDVELSAGLPVSYAKTYKVLPLWNRNGVVQVGVADPLDLAPLDALRMSLIAPGIQDAFMVTLVSAYFDENSAYGWLVSAHMIDFLPDMDRDLFFAQMAELEEQLLYARNRNWIPVINDAAQTHDHVFVAFGAAHLIGDQGVLALLEADGWSVTRR